MCTLLMIACMLGATIALTAAGPVSIVPVHKIDIPRYAFRYAVDDPLTHDKKAQWEVRNGDAVKGSYSLVEPDGTIRVVDYSADDHRGFNAVVKNIGTAVHPPPILTRVKPIVAPISYGFGSKPVIISPKSTSFGQWSLPWDPLTHSYGGWVPRAGVSSLNKPYLTILSKQYDDHGNLHKWISEPISLYGKTVIIKKKH